MKPLLTALIAALVLVLPLHADEPTERATVRFVDHEGKPIVGLTLQLRWSPDGTDPFESSVNEFPHRAYAVTDEQGRAVFSNVPMSLIPEGSSIIAVLHPRMFLLPPGSGLSSEDHQREREHSSELANFALDLFYEVDTGRFFEGDAVVQVREAVQFTFRLNPATDHLSNVQRNEGEWKFALTYPRQAMSSFEMLIPRGRSAAIGFLYDDHCTILEFTAEETREARVVEVTEHVQPLPNDAKIAYTARAWFPHGSSGFLRYALIRIDGSVANRFKLPPPLSLDDGSRFEDALHTIPFSSGEYVLLTASRDKRGLFTAWNEGGIFDTLLRLRRGEDLPHLKRITIPEGGTVELSTEDFLDPPAETETPAEPDPR